MAKYVEFSKSKDESRLSIDSQELIRQVESKINKAKTTTLTSPLQQLINSADLNDQQEQLDYLSFKEQTIIKRLFNLRNEQQKFTMDIQSYQDQLIQSIKEVINKILDKGNLYLQDQENELRLQLSEIQNNKELINTNSNCYNIQSPQKQIHNFFQEIKNKISQLNNQILEYFDSNNSSKSSQYQRKLDFSNYEELSSNTKLKSSPSPLKEIDQIINQPQDLNQFIEVLKVKINNTKNNNLLQFRPNIQTNFLQSKLNCNSKRLSVEKQLQSQYKTFFKSVY